jgi:hypothetical protein
MERFSFYLKAIRLKFLLRFYAVFEVIFSERFELTTWYNNGQQKSKTKFCKNEIDSAVKNRTL